MKYINKVTIDNFQSHSHTEIEFGKFVAIVGASDRGKTAIIRAINWCLYNYPMGTAFIKHGTNFAKVKVEFSDGTTIVRYRSKSENYYEFFNQKNEEEPTRLENFGGGPVDIIMSFHEMPEVDFLNNRQSLNICSQLDTPFFISESPQSKAVIIGKLSGTDIIDLAIKNTASDMRQAKKKKDDDIKKLEQIENKISQYLFLEDMKKDIEHMEQILASLRKNKEKIEEIKRAYGSILSLKEEYDMIRKITSKEKEVSSTSDFLSSLVEDFLLYKNLHESSQKLGELNDRRNKAKSFLSPYREDKFEDAEKLVEMLRRNNKKYMSLSEIFRCLSSLSESLNIYVDLQKRVTDRKIKTISSDLRKLSSDIRYLSNILLLHFSLQKSNNKLTVMKENISDAKKEYEKTMGKYIEALEKTKECPTCKHALSLETLEQIRNGLSHEVENI